VDKPAVSKWKTFFAVVFAVLFGLTLSFSLIAFNIENQLFNPEVYKKAILNQNVCERLPLIFSQQLLFNAKAVKGENNPIWIILKGLDPNTIQGFIKTIFPCQAIETSVLTGIDQLFDYINGKTSQETFSLAVFKQTSIENSKLAVEEYLESLPECTPAQLLQMGATALLGQENDNNLLSCSPPEAIRDVVTLPLLYLVESAVQDIPDQVSLLSRFDSLLNTIRTARIVLTWSPLLPMIFLVLTTLIVVRTWRDLMRWWGYPLLAAGIGTLIISLLVSPVIYSLITMLIFPNLPMNLVPEAIDLIAGTLAGVTMGLAQPIQIQSAILGLLGLGMILGEKISRPKH
jgi:hypothetical protein